MPHTTIDDRARKARIHERELNQLRRYELKLMALSDAEQKTVFDTLKKIDAANASNTPVTADKLPSWRDLRSLGLVVKNRDGSLRVSLNGKDFIDFVEAEAQA